MDEENVCRGSWKKMVISKASVEWISNIKSANGEQLKMNSPDFSITERPMAYIEIKVEKTDNPSEEAEGSNKNFEDPLLKEINIRQPKKSKKSSPKQETDEERAKRLAKMAAYAAHRLANESPEQRDKRLKRMSAYSAKRLAQETSEQRANRLAKMAAYTARRIASETFEQREARLAKMSAYSARRKQKANPMILAHNDSNVV